MNSSSHEIIFSLSLRTKPIYLNLTMKSPVVFRYFTIFEMLIFWRYSCNFLSLRNNSEYFRKSKRNIVLANVCVWEREREEVWMRVLKWAVSRATIATTATALVTKKEVTFQLNDSRDFWPYSQLEWILYFISNFIYSEHCKFIVCQEIRPMVK